MASLYQHSSRCLSSGPAIPKCLADFRHVLSLHQWNLQHCSTKICMASSSTSLNYESWREVWVHIPCSHTQVIWSLCYNTYTHTHTYVHTYVHTYIHHITSQYITSHHIALHHITSQYVTLRCVALRCLTLHYMTFPYMSVHALRLFYVPAISLQYLTWQYFAIHSITYRCVTISNIWLITTADRTQHFT